MTQDDDVVIYGSGSGSDSDSDSGDIYDEDGEFMEADKANGAYYIGLCGYVPEQPEPLLLSSISANAFFNNTHGDILEYLRDYSTTRVDKPAIDIMKLCVDDRQTYNVVVKTHWLRLFQRKCKKVYAERQKFINSRKHPRALRYRSLNGKWKYD
uniref:Uncharacterized protein n=1 Tax=viral metagenome TaxID=1070528 RepID=A0A6C0F0Z2_9ZZZZ